MCFYSHNVDKKTLDLIEQNNVESAASRIRRLKSVGRWRPREAGHSQGPSLGRWQWEGLVDDFLRSWGGACVQIGAGWSLYHLSEAPPERGLTTALFVGLSEPRSGWRIGLWLTG